MDTGVREAKMLDFCRRKSAKSEFIVSHVTSLNEQGRQGVHFCLVFPLMAGTIQNSICRFETNPIPIPIIQRLMYSFLQGIEDLHHNCRVIHNDIKPDNVFSLFEFHRILKAEIESMGRCSIEKQTKQQLVD